MNLSDEELLQKFIKAGDKIAFNQLIIKHMDYLWSIARKICYTDADASDCIQETLLVIFEKAKNFRFEANVKTWLHRILINKCLDYIRQHRNKPTLVIDFNETSLFFSDNQNKKEEPITKITVAQALNSLSYKYKSVLVAIDMYGYSIEETAKLLKISKGTVKSRSSRGRAKLAVILKNMMDGTFDFN